MGTAQVLSPKCPTAQTALALKYLSPIIHPRQPEQQLKNKTNQKNTFLRVTVIKQHRRGAF